MASARDSEMLRRGGPALGPPSLDPYSSTAGHHQHVNTATSPVSGAPDVANSIQPYNPQAWMASPAALPEGMQSGTPRLRPSSQPPPPYSPPRTQQRRSAFGVYGHGSSTVTTGPVPLSLSNIHRASMGSSCPLLPQVQGSSSQSRFRLSAPIQPQAQDSACGSSGPYQSSPLARRSMGPLAPYMPETGSAAETATHQCQGAPAAARRSSSTGAIDSPTSARSRSESQSRWEPGMPLPPPPPGPPPASGPSPRSKSVQPLNSKTVPIIAIPNARRPPGRVTELGPVPPTPAGWVNSQSERARSPMLTIDVAKAETAGRDADPPFPSSSSLSRAKAVRHDKTIHQRRAESRSRNEASRSIDDTAQVRRMGNIAVPSRSSDAVAKLTTSKSTPQSGRRSSLELPSEMSRNSTPRTLGSARRLQLETPTSPLSPHGSNYAQQSVNPDVQGHVVQAPPTPTPWGQRSMAIMSRDISRSASDGPGLHSKLLVASQTAEEFAAVAVGRFQLFASEESLANTDTDRVRLFAEFIVTESRIRRERYSSAVDAMGSEILDLTRDLFRPMTPPRRASGASREWTPEPSEPARSQRGSFGSIYAADKQADTTPSSASQPNSESGVAGTSGNWTSNYMPALSPILSMNMSASGRFDDGSSRGRPSSRWFESNSQGEPIEKPGRSKRESKYMGVRKYQLLEDDEHEELRGATSTFGYPAEKTGWHESIEASSEAPQPLHTWQGSSRHPPSPTAELAGCLDVSRLVTLPPPYPRHHPAVSNSHPELASIRTSVRALADMTQVNEVKRKFANDSLKRREDFAVTAKAKRQMLRSNLEQDLASGNLAYSDAAAIESQSFCQENSGEKELEKDEYDRFQGEVVMPLNELFAGRIVRATELFGSLSHHLFDNGEINPDMAQEEGDDRPELLEKMTLLKWIYEAREALHRALYDLLSERNGRYRDVVTLPYRLSGNQEKLKSAEEFFAEDAARREHEFRVEALQRTREFQAVVEQAVGHGVALRIAAFWDIAPPLRSLLESIPADLEGFRVQVPAAEVEENPSYRDHPLQYLFSLLLHAEKSTYQFIESHTNLLCLLHEVKEAAVHAEANVRAIQVEDGNGSGACAEERETQAREMREREEQRLTVELQDKVRVVQDQWNSALGESIKHVKERTGERLLQTGGWDEALEDIGNVGEVD